MNDSLIGFVLLGYLLVACLIVGIIIAVVCIPVITLIIYNHGLWFLINTKFICCFWIPVMCYVLFRIYKLRKVNKK